MHIFFISPDRHLSQKYAQQWVITSYGYANQWIIDPASRNPGKTCVHRCPILVSKCKVDLIFGYSTRAEEFWDGYRKAFVFMHRGWEGGAGHGVGIWLFLLALGWGIWLIFFSRGRGYLNPQTRTKTKTNHWPIIRFPLHSMRCKVWKSWKSV